MPTDTEAYHVVVAGLGFAALVLLWVAVLAGYLLRNAWALSRIRRPTLEAIHHTVAVLGLCLGAAHGLAQLAAPAGSITPAELVVPFLDGDDPIGIGAAVLGLDLLVVVTVSMAFARRLGYARWRVVHLLAYTAYLLIVAHVLVSGSDTAPVWVWLPIVLAWLVTVGLWASTTSVGGTTIVGQVRRRLARPSDVDEHTVAVRVDLRLCARFGVCQQVAPHIFRLSGDGQLSYRSRVPVEHSADLTRAAEACPTHAIALASTATVRTQPGRPSGAAPRGGALSVPGVGRSREISQQ